MPITCEKKLIFLFLALGLLFRFTKSDPSSECRTVVDICLVIDGSDSISKGDYEKQRDATANLMTNLDIADNRVRVGIVVFSTTIADEVPLSSDKELLTKRAQSLPHPRDGTNTALAIKTMRTMFQSYGRPNTPWIGIVITDGISKDPKLTMEEAHKARAEGISLIAVGITTLIDSTELLNIAGVESRVLKLESFDELKGALAGLAKTICPCDTPPVIIHAVIGPGPRTVGTVRLYECLEGYRGLGSGQITCLENSTWTIPTLECVACPDPPLVSNSVADIGPNLIGSIRTYTCKDGFVVKGNTSIVCQPDARWSSPEFICDICPETPIVPYAVIGPGEHFIGSLRVFQCVKGFRATAPSEIVCQKDGTWSKPAFQCVACPEPPLVINALIEPGSNLIGSVRQYVCEDGFLASGRTSIECSPEGGWTPPEFSCIACGIPLIVNNAIVDAGSNLIGSIRTYTCTDGYRAKGKTNIVCQADANWSPVEFVCDACPEPAPVQHASLKPGSYLIGSVRQYVCEKGYLASGPTSIECLLDAVWTSPKFACIACLDPPLVPNADVDVGSNLIGAVRNYKCVKGFLAKGNTSIVCRADAKWSPPEFACDACTDPPLVSNSMVDIGSNLIGSIRTYTCKDGFVVKGKTSIVCQPDAHWSSPEFICDTCPEPPLVKNALIEPGSNLIGSVRHYVCEDGFLASGPATIKCSPDGSWTPPEFSCIVCGDTPLVPNAKIRQGPYLVGTVRTYDCLEGYKAAGATDILCLKDATWSKPDFTCITCGSPLIVKNAMVDAGSNLIGSIRTYTCTDGYRAKGKTNIVCQTDANWSPVEFVCNACLEPPLVQNAVVEPGSLLIGSVRHYKCEKGYLASGPAAVECLPDLLWSSPKFSCIACGDTPIVPNAVIRPGSHLIDTLRTYDCLEGYIAAGSRDIFCQKNAIWSPTEFVCIACDNPPIVPNALVDVGSNLIGSLRTYTCRDGYLAKGKTSIVCQPDAHWSPIELMCDICGSVPLVLHAVVLPGPHLIGTIRNYKCEKGFVANGATDILCTKEALWSPPTFECKSCIDPPLVENAIVDKGFNLIESTRTYVCNKGYMAKGDTSIICQKDASWSPVKFICDDCGTPPLVKNAVVSPGESLLGEFRIYTCIDGLIPTGPAGIVCQDNATWTAPAFTCVECRSLVDMIVVVDGSDSINAPDYEMLRGAIIKLIPELEMGDEKARVGIVVFSSDIHEVIPFTGNSTSLINNVKYLYHPRDGTNTAKGIQKMREMFQSNGRHDVPWLGIVITDGISKQPLQTKLEADSAKAEGVYMIAVGVTDRINQEELENISSSTKQVLQLETFGQLSKELINLMRNVCRKKTPSLLLSILQIKKD